MAEESSKATKVEAPSNSAPTTEAPSSALVSARVFECYSPPPVNSFKGAITPRVLSKHRRRRKISVEVHRVSTEGASDQYVEECIVRVLDPASEEERRAARKRAKQRRDQLLHHGGTAAEMSSVATIDGDDDDASTVVPSEFMDHGSANYATGVFDKDWVAKYRFPLRALSIKGTHKTGVTIQVSLRKTKQVRELIFDSTEDAELFQSVITSEQEKEHSRAQAKVVAALGKNKAKSNESITFLIEIVSGWNIPAGDFTSSDPYVACRLNGIQVHRTKHLSKTLDPIWTLKTESLFLMPVTVEDLFLGEGLVCMLYDFDQVGKDEKLGCITIPPKQLYDAKGERMEFKLDPPPGKTDPVPGYMAIRCRRATEYDINFMEEYKQSKKQASLVGRKKPLIPTMHIDAKVGSGNIKSIITRKTRISKDEKKAGKKEYKVRPFPDPERQDETKWLTHDEVEEESLKPSQNWADTGSGSLGRLFVEIIGCDDLPNLDTGGFAGNKTDTFVALVYEDAVLRTDVIDDCLAPRWMPWCRRAFIFHMFHSSSQLFLGVFDYDAGINPADDHDLIGRVSVDVSNLRRNTTYVLKYHIYTTAKYSERKHKGTITIRLRMEIDDERKVLLSNLEPPPQLYVNAKTRRDFRMVRYTCTGKYDMDKYSMKVINSYIEEILALQHMLYYLQDGVVSLLLWRGTLPISLGSVTVKLPIHSLSAFLTAILLVERPQLIPSFCCASIAWLLLATNGYRRNLPDLWTRCKSFQEFVEVLVLGASTTPPHSIKAYENQEAAQAFLEQWQKRIEESEEQAKIAYEESVKQQEEHDREMGEFGDESTDIATKQGGVSIDPFKPILYPIQQNLAMVCRYLRHVKYIISWEECYISFWVTAGCILLSFVFYFVPWFFLFKWTSRLIVWTVFGPWMKLVDVFYVSKIKPPTEEELEEQKKQEQEKHRTDLSRALSTIRVKRENAAKLKAMKKYMFGKFIIRVPVLKEDRYRDLPLASSTAVPYRPDPRPLSELAMDEVGYNKTRVPGQHLMGDMIPRMEEGGFTEAPIGQATAKPELVDKGGAGTTFPNSTTAAYATIGSLVVTAGVLTWFGVPLLGAATKYALKKFDL